MSTVAERGTQLERDFVAWLGRLSEGVEFKSQCWLESELGEDSGEEYCPDCADKAAEEEAALMGPPYDGIRYTKVRSYDSMCMEEDCQPFCASCGAVLQCSPTKYHIDETIEAMADWKQMDATEAALIHDWMTGMGDYRHDEHWPLIVPHAKRLMKAAGEPVPKANTIRWRPVDAFGNGDWYEFDPVWYVAYEWIARKVSADVLHLGSGRGHWSFEPLVTDRSACEQLANLFRHAGKKGVRGKFLASIGIKNESDLLTPIVLPDRRPERLMGEFTIQGRRLKRPGPNQCHPEALEVYAGRLCFQHDGFWRYEVNYSYPHDASSWHIGIEQKPKQSTAAFFASIAPWLNSVMEPDTEGSGRRLHRLQQWNATHKAIKQLFWFDLASDEEIQLADALQQIEGGGLSEHRIDLSIPGRLEMLTTWLEEDVARKKARKKAEREAYGRC